MAGWGACYLGEMEFSNPALILLDEPSTGLDPKTLKQVFDTISLMHNTGRMILLVEQNVRTIFIYWRLITTQRARIGLVEPFIIRWGVVESKMILSPALSA